MRGPEVKPHISFISLPFLLLFLQQCMEHEMNIFHGYPPPPRLNMTSLMKVSSRLKILGRCSSWYWNNTTLIEFKSFYIISRALQTSKAYNASKTTDTAIQWLGLMGEKVLQMLPSGT